MNTRIKQRVSGSGHEGQLENPRGSYEASGTLGRPSTLERGSSTTKRSQAVPTRASQIDLLSLIATRALPQGLAAWRINM